MQFRPHFRQSAGLQFRMPSLRNPISLPWSEASTTQGLPKTIRIAVLAVRSTSRTRHRDAAGRGFAAHFR